MTFLAGQISTGEPWDLELSFADGQKSVRLRVIEF
jgi:hypothetical protein